VTLIVFPAVILSFYFAIHAALVFHGRSVVAAAAQDGLRAAQIEGGTAADGRAAADQTLSLAPGLRNPSVNVNQTNDTVTVTVSAHVDTLLAEMFSTVSAEVTGPRERFYSEAERK
jgi:Flp pilus assembly protein TadG